MGVETATTGGRRGVFISLLLPLAWIQKHHPVIINPEGRVWGMDGNIGDRGDPIPQCLLSERSERPNSPRQKKDDKQEIKGIYWTVDAKPTVGYIVNYVN